MEDSLTHADNNAFHPAFLSSNKRKDTGMWSASFPHKYGTVAVTKCLRACLAHQDRNAEGDKIKGRVLRFVDAHTVAAPHRASCARRPAGCSRCKQSKSRTNRRVTDRIIVVATSQSNMSSVINSSVSGCCTTFSPFVF